jgi:hypothetical protein
MKMPAKEPASWLPRQVSNLDFFDPDLDVLNKKKDNPK